MFFSKFGRINWIWTYLFELWFSFFCSPNGFMIQFFGAYHFKMGGNKPPTRWNFPWPTFLWNTFFWLTSRRHDGCAKRAIVEASYEMESWTLCWYHDWQVDRWLPGGLFQHKTQRKSLPKTQRGRVIKWIGCILMYIFYIYLTFDTHTYLYIDMKICCRHRDIPITWALTEVWAIVETVGSVYYDINATKTRQNSSLKPLRISSINSMLWKVVVGGLLYL